MYTKKPIVLTQPMEQAGGGASPITEQAAGSSAATDVSLREYVHLQIAALEQHVMSQLEAMRTEFRNANAAAKEAVSVASTAAKEQLEAHNGLIRQMQEKDGNYSTRDSLEAFRITTDKRIEELKATWDARLEAFRIANDKRIEDLKSAWDARQGRIENFQSKLAGAIALVAFIGATNLAKVWLTP